jgi:hypothetical protein
VICKATVSKYKNVVKVENPWNWVWWYPPVIPTLGRLKQEYYNVDASLGYIGRS